jgi:hypothetical protein
MMISVLLPQRVQYITVSTCIGSNLLHMQLSLLLTLASTETPSFVYPVACETGLSLVVPRELSSSAGDSYGESNQ